jgi:HD superfamily phosphodiesterase
MDPISLFALCKTAHIGIKECIELYKDFKQDGKEVGEIVNDIGSHLGKFFTHQESLKEAEKQERLKPLDKKTTINEEAMNRILRQEQIYRMETELREMIIYELNMGGLWSKFAEMREVVRKEREKLEREQKKPVKMLKEKSVNLLLNGNLELQFVREFLHGSWCLAL